MTIPIINITLHRNSFTIRFSYIRNPKYIDNIYLISWISCLASRIQIRIVIEMLNREEWRGIESKDEMIRPKISHVDLVIRVGLESQLRYIDIDNTLAFLFY